MKLNLHVSYLSNKCETRVVMLRPWYHTHNFWSAWGSLANVFLDISRFSSYATVDHLLEWRPYLMINLWIRFDERTFLFSASCPPVCWPRPSSKSSCFAAAVKRVTEWPSDKPEPDSRVKTPMIVMVKLACVWNNCQAWWSLSLKI